MGFLRIDLGGIVESQLSGRRGGGREWRRGGVCVYGRR